jgi:hypothetical protein
MNGHLDANGSDLKARAAAMLAAARDEYVADARRGLAGVETATRHADRLDDVVRMIVDAACDLMATPVVVCAVGG